VKALPRIAAAFLLAPSLGVVAAAALMSALTFRLVDVGFITSAAPMAYLVAAVIGIPAFLMSRAWLPISLPAYALVGTAAASFIAIPVAFFFKALAWGLVILFAGASAGVAFGLILGTKSNQRLERP
jgi:hypothetical protein